MNVEEIRRNMAGKILEFSFPAIISMALTAFITVADGFFMGNYVGKEGIAAVNLGLPVIYLYLGIGLMVSVGGVAMAGMALGSGDRSASNQVFRQTVATTAAFSGLISVVFLFCFRPMLSFLGAEGQVAAYFQEYYQIMLLELPVMVVNSSLGMFIRGEGNPSFYMKVTVANAALNVILDAVLAGCLAMGAAGIALASLISALASFGWLGFYFVRKARIYRFGGFRFSREIFVRGMLNGSSEFIGEMSTGMGYNKGHYKNDEYSYCQHC